MNRNTRRTRPTRPTNNNRRSNRRVLSQLHGHQNRLRHLVPPPVNRRPYNTLTLDHVYDNKPESGTGERLIELYGPPDIWRYWVNQMGLKEIFDELPAAQQIELQSRFNFRLKRIDAFLMTTGAATDRPSLFLDVASLVPSVSDQANPSTPRGVSYGLLKRIEDSGNLSECAKCSYTFPLHMADLPLNPIADFNFAAVSGNVDNITMRFHIEWSLSDSSTPVS